MLKIHRKGLLLISGPVLAFIVYNLLLSATGSGDASKMGAVAVWMAFWWVTEAVSLYVTSLIPLILYPFAGIMPMKEVAPNYTNEIIFLFIGGFILSFAIQKWDLHRRIALKILSMTGSSPSSLLFGFMLSAYFLSMWISNTATAMMLLPAVLAVSSQMEVLYEVKGRLLGVGLLLGLAYACSIGGTATLIGSPPNMIFYAFYQENFPGNEINFTSWMMFGLPVSALFLVMSFLSLRWLYIRKGLKLSDPDYAKDEYRKLGPVTWPQKLLLIVSSVIIFLWLFRVDIQLGSITIRGWTNLFGSSSFITDSTVAMLGAISLFFIPSGRGGPLLYWEDAKRLPLGVIFLFGGGFALANGIMSSGLSDWLALQLTGLSGLDPFLLILILATFMTFFTEFTSNTASTYLVLPILLSLSQSIEASPLLIMLPVVFSASYAFMMPVATPPNTVIFGSEKIRIGQMVRTGAVLNLIGISIITLAVYYLSPFIFK